MSLITKSLPADLADTCASLMRAFDYQVSFLEITGSIEEPTSLIATVFAHDNKGERFDVEIEATDAAAAKAFLTGLTAHGFNAEPWIAPVVETDVWAEDVPFFDDDEFTMAKCDDAMMCAKAALWT